MLSLLSPVSFNLPIVRHGKFLMTLDVCDAGGHCLSSGSESACIYVSPVELRVFEAISLVTASKPSLAPLLFAFQKDRPPQV
jgi:hypothetical protein